MTASSSCRSTKSATGICCSSRWSSWQDWDSYLLRYAKRMDERISREQTEKENRMRRELTQNIAHELKTPVASILGYTDTILDSPDMTDEVKHQFIVRTNAQGSSSYNIVARHLDPEPHGLCPRHDYYGTRQCVRTRLPTLPRRPLWPCSTGRSHYTTICRKVSLSKATTHCYTAFSAT